MKSRPTAADLDAATAIEDSLEREGRFLEMLEGGLKLSLRRVREALHGEDDAEIARALRIRRAEPRPYVALLRAGLDVLDHGTRLHQCKIVGGTIFWRAAWRARDAGGRYDVAEAVLNDAWMRRIRARLAADAARRDREQLLEKRRTRSRKNLYRGPTTKAERAAEKQEMLRDAITKHIITLPHAVDDRAKLILKTEEVAAILYGMQVALKIDPPYALKTLERLLPSILTTYR